MSHEQRFVKLELHAESNAHLDKLLELAIFELKELQKNTLNKEPGEVSSAFSKGSAGEYKLEYMISSVEVKALIDDLLAEGYVKVGSTIAYGDPVYRHPDTEDHVKVMSDPARVEKYEMGSF